MYIQKNVLNILFMTTFLLMAIGSFAYAGIELHTGDTLFIGLGAAPSVDGSISAGEWSDALSVVLQKIGESADDVTVYLKHDIDNLYAAFENTNINYWVWWILIDTQNNGGTAPQADDYKLIGPGFQVENIGDGSGWTQVTPTDWTVAGDEYVSECSIAYGKLGITSGIAKTLGIAFCYGGAMPWENVWPPELDTWNDEVVPNAWGDIVSIDNWGQVAIEEKIDRDTDAYFQSHPNPFSNMLVINFTLDNPACAKVQIYDAAGRLKRTLMNQKLYTGQHKVCWDRKDQEGKIVPQGTYFCQLKTGKQISTHSIVVID